MGFVAVCSPFVPCWLQMPLVLPRSWWQGVAGFVIFLLRPQLYAFPACLCRRGSFSILCPPSVVDDVIWCLPTWGLADGGSGLPSCSDSVSGSPRSGAEGISLIQWSSPPPRNGISLTDQARDSVLPPDGLEGTFLPLACSAFSTCILSLLPFSQLWFVREEECGWACEYFQQPRPHTCTFEGCFLWSPLCA